MSGKEAPLFQQEGCCRWESSGSRREEDQLTGIVATSLLISAGKRKNIGDSTLFYCAIWNKEGERRVDDEDENKEDQNEEESNQRRTKEMKRHASTRTR